MKFIITLYIIQDLEYEYYMLALAN